MTLQLRTRSCADEAETAAADAKRLTETATKPGMSWNRGLLLSQAPPCLGWTWRCVKETLSLFFALCVVYLNGDDDM